MRTIHKLSAALLVVGGLAVVGCKPSTPPADPAMPTTMTAPPTNGAMPATMPAPSAAVTEIAIPHGPPPAAASLTHTLATDQPFFLNEPSGADPKPVGTLKAGSKVLLIIPGATYSQVTTDMGISCFTPTAGLNPLGK